MYYSCVRLYYLCVTLYSEFWPWPYSIYYTGTAINGEFLLHTEYIHCSCIYSIVLKSCLTKWSKQPKNFGESIGSVFFLFVFFVLFFFFLLFFFCLFVFFQPYLFSLYCVWLFCTCSDSGCHRFIIPAGWPLVREKVREILVFLKVGEKLLHNEYHTNPQQAWSKYWGSVLE